MYPLWVCDGMPDWMILLPPTDIWIGYNIFVGSIHHKQSMNRVSCGLMWWMFFMNLDDSGGVPLQIRTNTRRVWMLLAAHYRRYWSVHLLHALYFLFLAAVWYNRHAIRHIE